MFEAVEERETHNHEEFDALRAADVSSGDEDAKAAPPRPFFIPEGINFEEMPPAVQTAFREIIQPVYESLVVRAASPIERSAATTLVALLTLEIVEQFKMGATLNFAELESSNIQAADREGQIGRLLRISGAKHKTHEFLLKLEQLRLKHGPHCTWARYGVSTGSH